MSEAAIRLRGVRVHNLRGVDVDVPLGKLTAVTGVSGAGKSSLVFDTLYAEAQRRYLQGFSTGTRQLLERFDQPDADEIGDLPPAIAVGRQARAHHPRASVGTLTELSDYLQMLFARTGVVHCTRCGQPVRADHTADVLAAAAALPAGTRFTVAFPDRPDSADGAEVWAASLLEQGLVRVQVGSTVYRLGDGPPPAPQPDEPVWVLLDRLEAGKMAPERLAESVDAAFARGGGRMALLLDGAEHVFDQRLVCLRCEITYPAPEPRLFDVNDPLGACPTCHGTGTVPKSSGPCPTCGGRRWNEHALAVRVAGKTIADISGASLAELAALVPTLSGGAPSVGVLIEQLRQRLDLLTGTDLGYLSLARPAATLSAGELRRLRLCSALASSLVQALYVIDEPTVGLHPRDTGRLIGMLHRLRDAGNTVVVVEHDLQVVAAVDHVIDVGPEAGDEGGRITYQGPPAGLEACDAPTGDYWCGRSVIAVPSRRRSPAGSIRLSGARTHNLKDLTVEFPLGVLCVVTGVSGAGKSSLVLDTLFPALAHAKKKKGTEPTGATVRGASGVEDVIIMDQEPLGRSVRSNPATYLKIFDEVRELFAETTEAKIRGLGPGHFSFNQPGGRCETCEGQGALTVDMQFLADVSMVCPECHGSRYRREVLDVKVRSRSIAEVLDLTAREAFRFFRAQRGIERRLRFLLDVGLDYLRLGQPADTLSGGESQRLKLAGHLAASRKPRTLFLLDEPSAGLHLADVTRLLESFDRLLQTGHSLVVIEHHLDVIKCADHVIDLGPEAGQGGGRVVAAGTPAEVARVDASHTGRCLQRVLAVR